MATPPLHAVQLPSKAAENGLNAPTMWAAASQAEAAAPIRAQLVQVIGTRTDSDPIVTSR